MKKINFILLVCFHSALWSQTEMGKSSLNPIKFNSIRYWLDDDRPSIQLLEQTLRTDMLGVRSHLKVAEESRWIKLTNQLPRESTLYHFTFQGIFWAPIFSAVVWTPFALLTDFTLNYFNSDWEYLTTAAVWSTVITSVESQQQNTFADLIKLNIIYVSDVVGLSTDGLDGIWNDSNVNLSRSYAGLALKILDTNYLFAGYSFVDIPYLEGWEAYVQEKTQQQGNQVFVFTNKGLSTGELFFYNNYANLLSLTAVIDWGAEAILNFLGLGLYLNFFNVLRPDLYLNYIRSLSRLSLDTQGDVKISDWLYFHWKWYLPFNDWKPLNDLRVGATLLYSLGSKEIGLGIRGDYITYYKGDEQKHGFFAETGLYLPASLRIIFGVSMNASENTKRLPFAEDVRIYHIRLEVGMDNNFDGRMQLKKEIDLLGFRVTE